MKKRTNAVISLMLAVIMILSCFTVSFAQESYFDDNAFASIITASDFQASGIEAYERFGDIIALMKKDGLEDPDSVLIGGDFSKMLPDYATQGVYEIEREYAAVYPDENSRSIISIQGNHDIKSSAFTKTGFYDMGSYCLYVINEDDFPWKQASNSSADDIKALASKVESSLNSMIEAGDTRPVIVMTHVPMHHTYRSDGGDNLYAEYLFDVINKAAEKLDIVFLFGHNHSSPYDDYIGGSVNMLKPGDTIRIADPDNQSTTEYLEKTLNFTYANYGYVGYSGNGTENGSTNVLTVGVIQISENNIRFVKYTEEGFYCSTDIARKTASSAKTITEYPELEDESSMEREMVLCRQEFVRVLYIAFNFVVSHILDLPTELWGKVQQAFNAA